MFKCPYYSFSRKYRLTPTLSVTTEKIEANSDKIKESLQVPILKGDIKPDILNYINGNLKDDIMQFKSQLEEASSDYVLKQQQQGKPIQPYAISNSYNITYNKDNILSISIIYQEKIDGKTSFIRTTYNYDLSAGIPLSLKDLFKPSSNYLKVLNTKVAQRLSPKYNFKGLSEDQPFFLENNNLVLFLSFNEIAPTASEIPLIRIPFYELKNNLISKLQFQ